MSGFVQKEYVDELVETVTGDHTVGIIDDVEGEIESEGLFHLGRVRRALLAFEEEVGAQRVEKADFAVIEDDDGRPFLALQHGRNASQVVVVAGITEPPGEGSA